MKTKIFYTILLVSFILTAYPISTSWSQSSEDQESRKLVESYVAAFNNNEETMRTFINENVSKSALEQRPVEARLSIYKQMRGNMGELTLHQIQETSSSAITALMHTKKDEWFLFTFMLEPEPPHKLTAIRIEDTDVPEQSGGPKLKEKDAIKAITQFLNEKMKKDEFSGTVLIAKDGKQIFKKAYGLASKEYNVANRPDTKYNLGSINKIFTQIAIGQLYEQGKLSLNDPIVKFLPDYPNKIASQKVTIRHLLDMSSGVGDFFGDKYDATPKDKFRTINDFLPMFASDSLQFEPGTQRQYSNGGYIVLGAIIEKVSGQSYYDYVREHIFKPAGMLNTESYEADDIVPNLAEGYTREVPNKPWRKNIYTRPARGSSAGGGYSTVDDLLKFTIAVEKKSFFKNPDTWAILRGESSSPKSKKSDGLGIYGGAPGINSGIETGIGKGYTAIVMANYDPPVVTDVMKQIKGSLKKVQ